MRDAFVIHYILYAIRFFIYFYPLDFYINHCAPLAMSKKQREGSSEKLIILFWVQVDERSLGICMLKDLSFQKISIQMVLFRIQNVMYPPYSI